MWKPESERRKDICIDCRLYKPIKAHNKCCNCWNKYKRHYYPEFFLRTRFTEIKQRCTNKKSQNAHIYFGKKFCSLSEFLNRFKTDSTFIKLFNEWVKSNHDFKKCPSVDRIDNNGDYNIDNIQFITHSDNCKKDQIKMKVNKLNLQNEIIEVYESQGEASRQCSIPQANIWKCLVGKRKTAGGFKWSKHE